VKNPEALIVELFPLLENKSKEKVDAACVLYNI
jgi:hypothetical protein